MRPSYAQLRSLCEAAEILHAHDEGPFTARVFRASRLLYAEASHAFEVFGQRDGSHTIASDMPWPDARYAELMRLSGEVVPKEHPLFPMVREGWTTPVRLSDLLSRWKLERTVLYNELFAPAHTRYQLALPFASHEYVGGLTINRGGKDYSDRDLATAHIFSRQVLVAYRSDQVLGAAREARATTTELDYRCLRARGLTRRECDVMAWVREGKHNAEIAIILAISRRTVEAHLDSVFRKLAVDNRTAALAALF